MTEPFVEALESAGLVHVVLPPNTEVFGGGEPATNLTPDEARDLARSLAGAADQAEGVDTELPTMHIALAEEELLWLEQAARFGARDAVYPPAAEPLDDLSKKLERAAIQLRRTRPSNQHQESE